MAVMHSNTIGSKEETNMLITKEQLRASMSPMKNIEIYQVVAGKRFQGGKVLKTFTSATSHKCGGPATAALRASQRMNDNGIECHLR